MIGSADANGGRDSLTKLNAMTNSHVAFFVTFGVLMIPAIDAQAVKSTKPVLNKVLADDGVEKCPKTESMTSPEDDVCLLEEASKIASLPFAQNGMTISVEPEICSPAEEHIKDSLDVPLNLDSPRYLQESTVMGRVSEKITEKLNWIRWTEYSLYAKDLLKTNKWESIQNELVSVVSYNILSQTLLQRHMYLYRNHDQRSLKWETRSQVLLNEIEDLNADILCLQEVDSSLYNSFYNYHFERLGYKGVYKQRTNDKVDGCAIFYRKDKFSLVKHKEVEMYKPFVHLLNRDNVGLILRLSMKSNPKTEFIVATTHLLYNPKRGDIKLVQTQMILAEIEKMAYLGYNALTQRAEYLPIIFTGDMNYSPENGVYRLVTKSFLEYEGMSSVHLVPSLNGYPLNKTLLPPDIGITDSCQYASSLNNRPGVKEMSFATGTLDHHLNLESVYDHVKCNLPEATTNQNRWVTVDYIFYSQLWDDNVKLKMEGNLKLISRLTLPNSQEAEAYLKRIPNLACGSDHLPLMATFQVKPENR